MNLSRVDLNLLVVLDALLRERSVTRAAARIGLSQPAMSNALNRLRLLLGDRLFIHTQRGMIPTARTQAISEQVRDALDQISRALSPTIAFHAATSTRRFHLATTDYGEVVAVPALVRQLKRIAPGVTLEIGPFDRVSTKVGLQSGEIDLGIIWRVEEQSFDARGFYTTPLFEEQLVCIARANHPVVRGRLSLRQFVELDHVVVSPTDKYHPVVDSVLGQQNLTRKSTVSAPHFLVAPFVVANSDLIATVASRIADIFRRSLNLQVLKPPVRLPRLSVRMVWHERSHQDPAHRWLRDTLAGLSSKI